MTHLVRRPPLFDRLLAFAITDRGLRWIVTSTITAIIGLAFLLEQSGWGYLRSALSVSGTASLAILFLTSRRLHDRIYYRSVLGYWEFHVKPLNPGSDSIKELSNPIAIIIDLDNNELRLRGWHFHPEAHLFFSTSQAVMSNPARTTGSLTYWYKSAASSLLEEVFVGVCTLEWNKVHRADTIDQMDGFWIRKTTRQVGKITYKRITRDEFRRRLTVTSQKLGSDW